MSFNHARAFERMKLIGDINDLRNRPELFVQVCALSVTDLPREVFEMMNQQIADNEPLCVKMFGESIVKRVKLYA